MNSPDLSDCCLTMPNGFDLEWKHYPPKNIGNTADTSIMEDLLNDAKWDEFLDCITSKSENPDKMMQTQSFIRTRQYREICKLISEEKYQFSMPTRFEIFKKDSTDKRMIYTFKSNKDISEHVVLKMIAWLFNTRYVHLLCPNLYSISGINGVSNAVNNLALVLHNGDKYCFKADITNFLNSINSEMVIQELYEYVDERDFNIVRLFDGIFKNNTVRSVNTMDNTVSVIEDPGKGIMTGVPFSPFLQNFFLKDMDWIFYLNNVPYFRFLDDIMAVTDSEESLDIVENYVLQFIAKKKLHINPKKIGRFQPGDNFAFLGIAFNDGKATITDNTVKKQKARIKAKAKKYRQLYEKGAKSKEEAVAMMITWMNGHCYGSDLVQHPFAKTYFPSITSSEKLGIIDKYTQQCIRYVYSGKMRTGGDCGMPYDKMKSLGYLPLVSAFRIYKNNK